MQRTACWATMEAKLFQMWLTDEEVSDSADA